ncbi:hypothetical protein KX729_26210 [Rhizobium sp. XQZ8]|uniref:DUF6894 family protein n=1 Tax=Rhizobium populisoli TaxID=2859785 RepID=UPI001CA4F58F|nr:hypothetical protein [Rhizobium populisoli]MBW6424940.1 hypothetical protein [Rhizobium populisoli]
MTRFFFDIIIGNDTETDEHGVELADRVEMRREAGRILTDIAKFEIDHTEELAIEVNVREDDGTVIHHGELKFRTLPCRLTGELHAEETQPCE